MVCHPFDPWSIGSIFRDAALACEATVLPLGLNSTDKSLWQTLIDFRPSVLCGSASVLVALGAGMTEAGLCLPASQRTVFHAGEPLGKALREECSVIWSSRIVDVYGSAEFDSIASEGSREGDLILCPEHEYAIASGKRELPLEMAPGVSGELLMRTWGATRWVRTRDRVLVTEKASLDDGLWVGSWKIRHQGRSDHSLILADGTIVRSHNLTNLLKTLPIQAIQVHWKRRTGVSDLRVLVVSQGRNQDVNAELVRAALLEECFELADSIKHGATILAVELVGLHNLERTSRGKVAPFVEAL